jgi:hypothetical protein
MVKFSLSLLTMILWTILLFRSFPTDAADLQFVFLIVLIFVPWLIAGIIFRLSKHKAPAAWIFAVLTVISCFFIYEALPWYDGYTGVQIIKDYAKKKRSVKKVEYSWIYDLPGGVKDLPLIDMAERKFSAEIKPDQCYLLRCFYSDSNTIQQYPDKYMIYFKNREPFTTNPKIAFRQTGDGIYRLSEQVEGKELFFVTVKESVIYLSSDKDNKLNTFENGINSIYLENGIYRCELKKTDANNGLDVRHAYWIYDLF